MAVQAQLDSLWLGLARAMIAGDTAQLAHFYSDSALFAETGAPTMRGRDSIRAGAQAVFACCRYLESDVRPEATELAVGRAFQFGTYRDVIQASAQESRAYYGRYSAVFDRDGANGWRIARMVVIRDSAGSVPVR